MKQADFDRFPLYRDVIVAIRQTSPHKIWGLVIVFYVFGDLLTTAIGLSAGGVIELDPIIGGVFASFGLFATIPLKILAVGMWFLLWRVMPDPYAIGIPLGLTIAGVFATGWNTLVLYNLYIG